MSNELNMADRETIAALLKQGWSKRRVARELELHRDTVRRYARELTEETAKAVARLPGVTNSEQAMSCEVASGSAAKQAPPEKVATGAITAEVERSRSSCERYRKIIEEKLSAGLSAQRIYQDLTSEDGYSGAYNAVKRMVRRLTAGQALPFRRMECEAGKEAQVDFGSGIPIQGVKGKRQRTHVLRLVLSHSRQGYSEAFTRQTTENLIACIENAFWSWGGVPQTLVIDNLKAAVTKADWYDPEINPKIRAFCKHYGTVVMPTKAYTPRHKGKIESGIKYVKGNALKGRVFETLSAQNRCLAEWEAGVAGVRIHGTTKKQVKEVFEQSERSALLPLPRDRFPFYHEGERSVHRDGHVEVDKAYYSVPPEYLKRKVWVRWDSRLVRVFNADFVEIALHVKHEAGRFSTNSVHLASKKMSLVEVGATELLRRARLIGPQAGRWAEAMLKDRGIEGVRVLVGMLSLAKRNTCAAIEQACQQAAERGAFRLRDVRGLIKEPVKQEQMEFMTEHAIIRGLKEYGSVVQVHFGKPWEEPTVEPVTK